MKRKICADSSCDLTSLTGACFAVAPLKIITDLCEFVDTDELETADMLLHLESYNGRSRTSCPNVDDWIMTFGDEEEIFAVTITSGLSGSFNSATVAAEKYTAQHPKRRVRVVDTLSVGPESALIIEKLRELIDKDEPFDEISRMIDEYMKKTRLIFSLESMKNLANNGRVSHVAARMAGLLGIRAIGTASDKGVLDMTDKVRGETGTLRTIIKNMEDAGYSGGKVRIHHVKNQSAAYSLEKMLRERWREADISIRDARGLCSFYAERGGILVGFETNL